MIPTLMAVVGAVLFVGVTGALVAFVLDRLGTWLGRWLWRLWAWWRQLRARRA